MVEEGAAAGKRRGVCMGLKAAGKAPGGRRRRASGGEATPQGSRAPGLPQDGPRPEHAAPTLEVGAGTALEFTAPPRLQVL